MTDQKISMTVKFEKEIEIYPPEFIEDKVEADTWFQSGSRHILQDAIDLRQGEIEVLSINA